MTSLLYDMLALLGRFQNWFDRRFGWFFTNGMKTRDNAHEPPVKA